MARISVSEVPTIKFCRNYCFCRVRVSCGVSLSLSFSSRRSVQYFATMQRPSSCFQVSLQLFLSIFDNGHQVVYTVFCSDYLLSIAACTLNVQSPRCYSQCKYIGCSVAFQMLQRKALGLSEILVDSNRSTRSGVP